MTPKHGHAQVLFIMDIEHIIDISDYVTIHVTCDSVTLGTSVNQNIHYQFHFQFWALDSWTVRKISKLNPI